MKQRAGSDRASGDEQSWQCREGLVEAQIEEETGAKELVEAGERGSATPISS